MWQIPYFVAVSYGLTITDYMDERCDVRKATPVAIAYLQKLSENHTDLWDVIIAYANSTSALKAAKIRTRSDNDIWSLYVAGKLSDKEIIPDFITWIYLAHFYQSHHIKPKPVVVYDNLQSVYPQKNIPSDLFVSALELDAAFFFDCNPVLTGKIIPMHCEIAVPKEKAELFSLKEDSLYAIADSLIAIANAKTAKAATANEETASRPVYYTVKSGDVLGRIAQKNNISVSQLKKWNNLKSDNIQIGQRLIVRRLSVPTDNRTNILFEKTGNDTKPVSSAKTNSAAAAAKENQNETVHIVQSGDVLLQIATKYNTTVEQIKAWNNLTGDNIQIGQKLIVRRLSAPTDNRTDILSEKNSNDTKPASSAKTTPAAASAKENQNETVHIVQSGDVLLHIAAKYNTTVEQLKAWNNLTGDNIQIGQKLIVRSIGTVPAQTPPSTAKSMIYTVKSGDTLGKIAKLYNVSVDDIKKWNNLTSDRIDIGQKLKILRASK
jgi:membrane-bound lytic murein transglycosylase D